MSNHRTAGPSAYRSEFLRSAAWFARRARWFRMHARTGQSPACAVCGRVGTSATLELHHLDYRGITVVDGRWYAFERHEDLMPMHPSCHELVHRLIDRDTVLSRQRTRRDATTIAIDRVRAALIAYQQAP